MSNFAKNIAQKISAKPLSQKISVPKQAITTKPQLGGSTSIVKKAAGSTVLPSMKMKVPQLTATKANVLANPGTVKAVLNQRSAINQPIASASTSPLSMASPVSGEQAKRTQMMAAAISALRGANPITNPMSPATLAGSVQTAPQVGAMLGSGLPAMGYNTVGRGIINPAMMVAGPGAPGGIPAGGISPDNPDWDKWVEKLSPAQQQLARVMKFFGYNIPAGWFGPTFTGLSGGTSDVQLNGQ